MGSLGLRLARPPFLAFDFSVRSVLARVGPASRRSPPATYFSSSSLLLLVVGCVGVSPVGSISSRLRDPPLTGAWCVAGVAPCRLCRG